MAVEKVIMKINRPDLYEKYFGAQDEGVKALSADAIYKGEWDTFVKTQSHVLDAGQKCQGIILNRLLNDKKATKNYYHYREDCDDYKNAYGYRNFQIIGAKPEDIDNIDIEIAGQTIDRIYPASSGDMTFGLFDVLDSIPALENHGLTIEFRFTEGFSNPVTFQYDIVHQKEHLTSDGKAVGFVYSQTQCTGLTPVTATKENVIPLNFNHPVTRIRIFSSKSIPILKASLVINGLTIDLFTPPMGGTKSFELLFDPTINFSRISSPELILTTAEDGGIDVFADNQQIMRMMSGMAGMAYSK